MTGGDFWTRRRAAVAAEAEAERLALRAVEDARASEVLAEKSDEEILAELGLKDPDALEPGDDFAAFLKAAVPERLRRRALRRLWVSNPVLANLDGLVDYDDDFTDAATVVPDLKTAYRVGKGMLEHILKSQPDEAPGEAVAEAGEPPASETQPEIGPEATPDLPAPEAPAAVTLAEAMPGQATPLPRRMRFEFT